MDQPRAIGTLRIGELARRTGVTPELLRAWEQRYGLLEPSRSDGGFRLYSERDERRVRATKALIAQGLSAAEAARRALEETAGPDVEAHPSVVAALATQLRTALDAFDGEGANEAFDRLLATVSVDALLREVVTPYLRELGDRWERGEVSVAQEHFASNLLRGRLLGLARGWAGAVGPTLVLACPPGEEHDMGLIMLGISAARRGRRVVFLGADTPFDTLVDTIRRTRPEAVVLSVTRSEALRDASDAMRSLTTESRVLVCGPGADPTVVEAVGAAVLEGDPVTAADRLAG